MQVLAILQTWDPYKKEQAGLMGCFMVQVAPMAHSWDTITVNEERGCEQNLEGGTGAAIVLSNTWTMHAHAAHRAVVPL
jgi:hypothetical protein